MSDKYLKPMLDTGSPRVFNINEMTRRVLKANPDAVPMFDNKQMNDLVLIKDAIPEADRTPLSPSVGTKLYFPFNENDIYEGGRTIFLHEKALKGAIVDFCGEGKVDAGGLEKDMSILRLLNNIPSLDPFLLKDIFRREKINVDEAYFDVSKEMWERIETFMLQKFEDLVFAAFPDSKDKESSDDKARILIDKIWEARDLDALQPLILAFRLPQAKALEIFSSWRGIVYYSFQYQEQQTQFIELITWLKENEKPTPGATGSEIKELKEHMTLIQDQLKKEWKQVEKVIKNYEDAYNKMFRDKIDSAPFLQFLQESDKTYWNVGNALGRTSHAVYCWDVMSKRYDNRKVPWEKFLELIRMLARILEPEKKAQNNINW